MMINWHFEQLAKKAAAEAEKKETPKEEKSTGAMETVPQKKRRKPSRKGE